MARKSKAPNFDQLLAKWTLEAQERHRAFVQERVEVLQTYAASCEMHGVRPLSMATAALACMIRNYRWEHRFYDCV
jgi:hypothetical protein